MKSRTLFTAILLLLSVTITAQFPQGFNYQAIARDAGGAIIANGNMILQITLHSNSATGTVLWQENHTLSSNQFGLIGCVVGKGTRVTGVTTFDLIDWNAQTVFIQTGIKYPTTAPNFVDMGATQVYSVPYALQANKANQANALAPGAKISIKSDNDADPDALFEVRNSDGQAIFSVYPDAVSVNVPVGAKGTKGGFTVGGFDGANKTDPYELFRVTPDSVRIYIDPNPSLTKGSKGGFAVGGYGAAKGGINDMYFNLSAATVANTVASSQQILWYPVKKAFIAGNVHIAHVDSVGDYSTSLGYQSQASGDYSQAFGYKAKAMGDYSTSIGKRSVAGVFNSKHNAFALGNAAQATGEDSYAFGSGALASGMRSFAFGSVAVDESGNPITTSPTKATADYTVALGMGAEASVKGAMALGVGSKAMGTSSSTLGYFSNATGTYSAALGFKAYALGNYSLALGDSSKSQANYSAAIGRYAKAKGTGSVAIGYNALTSPNGGYSGAFGYNTIAQGLYSVAVGLGAKTTITAQSAGAFGMYSTANGPYSVAIGPYASTLSTAQYASSFGYNAKGDANNSVAVGYGARTTGADASAFGKNSLAQGSSSTAIGFGSSTGLSAASANAFGTTAVANGQYSLALGTSTTAGGNYSTSIGYGSSAAGVNAISIGISTTASATNSAAFGTSAQATASNALAMGTSTIASGTNSTAIGYQTSATGDKAVAIGSFYTYNATIPILNIAKGGSDPIDGEESKAIDDFLIIRPPTLYTTFTRSFSRNNTATGQYSLAIGNGNNAQAGGQAFGSYNDAIKFGALALGTSSSATETNSTAIGYNAVANGIYSVAIGNNVTANSYGEIALGQWNPVVVGAKDTWNEGDLLFTVGNGTSDADRTNALTIYKDGKSTLTGRYASTTFNYKIRRRMLFPSFPITYKDYVYGTYSLLNRDDTSIEYYYSGYFAATGTAGLYKGLYADLLNTPSATITDLTVSDQIVAPNVFDTPIVTANGYRVLYIDGAGTIGYLTSSLRYKKDIEDLNDINWLYNLRPVSYRYKNSESATKEIGLIAEEVEKVNPNFVSLNEKGDPETVSYSQLVTPLLKAVQDQKATIEELKSENEMLRERLEKLEASVSKISKKQRK